jgi:hypothetical protein
LNVKRNFLKYMFIVLGLALSASATAFAGPPHTPEVDPGMAVSGLTLFVGSLAVLRVRRKK